MTSYDLCVLGAGPGGLSAAIRGAQKGARVALVDPGPLGGTCLNRGCIPARALGTTARLVSQLKTAQNLGIRLGSDGFQVDLAAVVSRKERILRRLRAGLVSLVQQSRVDWLMGSGLLQGIHEVEVRIPDKPAIGINAKTLILATGSRPSSFAGVEPDGKKIFTSDEILDLSVLPHSLTVIGAGVIGSEFASYFSDLGTSVTLIEMAPRVLPSVDERIAAVFARSLKRRGVRLLTGVRVEGIRADSPQGPEVLLNGGEKVVSEQLLLAAGRTPRLPEGAKTLGIRLKGSAVETDSGLRTSVPTVFAIGDLLGGHQLACTASYEGALAAENALLGASREVEYSVVPDAIYTEPEIASVGLTQAQAEGEGYTVSVSSLSLTGFARAQTLEETEGLVQVVADKLKGRLLGVQIIGPRATDLIGEAALAIQHRLSLQDLVETLHGHPTMSESLWETAAMALGQSIYYASPVAS